MDSVSTFTSSMNIHPYLSTALQRKSIQISSKFSMWVHPIMHKYCLHKGIDLQAHYEKVFSMFPSEMVAVGQDDRSGKYMTIRTASYIVSYCHLFSTLLPRGIFVDASETIACLTIPACPPAHIYI